MDTQYGDGAMTSSESGQLPPVSRNLSFPNLESLWFHLLNSNVPSHYLESCQLKSMFKDLPRGGMDLDALKFFLATGYQEDLYASPFSVDDDEPVDDCFDEQGVFSHDDLETVKEGPTTVRHKASHVKSPVKKTAESVQLADKNTISHAFVKSDSNHVNKAHIDDDVAQQYPPLPTCMSQSVDTEDLLPQLPPPPDRASDEPPHVPTTFSHCSSGDKIQADSNGNHPSLPSLQNTPPLPRSVSNNHITSRVGTADLDNPLTRSAYTWPGCDVTGRLDHQDVDLGDSSVEMLDVGEFIDDYVYVESDQEGSMMNSRLGLYEGDIANHPGRV